MKKKRFSLERTVAVLERPELGAPVAEGVWKVGIRLFSPVSSWTDLFYQGHESLADKRARVALRISAPA